jgi:hypothetical protein
MLVHQADASEIVASASSAIWNTASRGEFQLADRTRTSLAARIDPIGLFGTRL